MNSRINVFHAGLIGILFGVASYVSAAQAGSPTLPTATGNAFAQGNFTSPTVPDDGDVAETGSGVPLSTYGDQGSYVLITTISGGSTTTEPNTPGVVASVGVSSGSVTMDRTSPSILATGSWGCCNGGGDYGTLAYWFEVVNNSTPNTSSPVAIEITASGGISGSASTGAPNQTNYGSSAQVNAELQIYPGLQPPIFTAQAYADFTYTVLRDQANISLGATTSNVTIDFPNAAIFGTLTTFSGGFSLHNDPLTIYTNMPYEVVMNVSIAGGESDDASAWVDPYISTPGGYTLYLSPGIVNGVPSSIPEPSTWAMMLAGFGGLGFLGWRRARRGAPAA
jgi:PEP-CTERM motif